MTIKEDDDKKDDDNKRRQYISINNRIERRRYNVST